MMGVLRKVVAAVAGTVVVMVLVTPAGAAPALASESTVPRVDNRTDDWSLPAPTGRYPVGQDVLYLVDEDRPDPWVPSGLRELMVSVWYPAAAAQGGRVPYATAEESRLVLRDGGVTGVPEDALTRVGTHARADAPLRTGERRPLVVLSPGFGLPRWTLTALAEDLASRGYVVVGVDHNYEASAITFPDGRVTECVTCSFDELSEFEAVAASRAVDISFVLDRLIKDKRYGRVIDQGRIAVVGHSLGGAAAATTMLADQRVDAGVNMDGSFLPGLETDLARPFLMLGAGPHGLPGSDPSWDATWPHLTGWRLWLDVPQMAHLSVSDIAVIGEWLGLDQEPLPGVRCVEIIRTYVTAFVHEHLRHLPQPLLDGPSPSFPEVDFVGPTI